MDWNTTKELGSMEELVAKLEREAYYKLLRAFRIQSNDLSWEKESILTNLREQLGISNDVHGELLRTLDSDDLLQNAIRQKEKPTSQGGDQHAIGNKSPRPIRTRRISELEEFVRHENVWWKRAEQETQKDWLMRWMELWFQKSSKFSGSQECKEIAVMDILINARYF